MQNNCLKLRVIFFGIIFFGIFGFFGLAKNSQAATYWVSPTGAAANLAACSGSTPLDGSLACSYDKANGSGVVGGDTVYYRTGLYTGITGSFINPYNTGSSGNIITFSAYDDEDVQVTGFGTSSMAVNLNSDYGTVRSYIKVHDIHFNDFMAHLWILKGTHNEISNCSFIGYPATATQADFVDWFQASYIYRQAQYNWIHHSIFGKWGYNATYGNDNGGVFGMGLESSTNDNTRYNLVENNEMYAGGHHVAYLNGSYNIYRNNYFHNEPWYPLGDPVFSTRVVAQEGYPGDGMRNLNEGNRIGYGGPKNKDEIGGSGSQVKGAYNIWRKNLFVQIYTNAMYLTKYANQSDVKYNKIYNNTFWNGGYGMYQVNPGGTAPSNNWEDRYTHAVVVEEGGSGASIYGNVFKNNLFHQNKDVKGAQYSIISSYYDQQLGWIAEVPQYQMVTNNWLDNAGNPKFVDTVGAPDPANENQWNFNLQPDSPCIDNGAFLTTISSASGSGTSFTVADAGYFFDGWGIGEQIPSASIVGDTIQLSGQTQAAVVTAIDYDTNVITVDTSLTWTEGQGVSLYYNGLAPDYGAYEYISDNDITPPSAPADLNVT